MQLDGKGSFTIDDPYKFILLFSKCFDKINCVYFGVRKKVLGIFERLRSLLRMLSLLPFLSDHPKERKEKASETSLSCLFACLYFHK